MSSIAQDAARWDRYMETSKIDADAAELTYQQYVTECKHQRETNSTWITYPPASGKIYVFARNKFLGFYRLIEKEQYIRLRDSGAWAQGIDREKKAPARRIKTTKESAEEIADSWRIAKIRQILEGAQKNAQDFGQAMDAINEALEVK